MLNEAGLKAAVEANAERLGRPVWEEDFPPIRAAITAYLASVQGEPVAVKKLEWDTYVLPPFITFARTPIGTYRVECRGPNGWWFMYSGTLGDMGHDTEDEAKAAAQADFENRIRSAITTHPADRDSVVAGGWRPIETAPRGEDILVGGRVNEEWKWSVYCIRDEFWREDWEHEEPTHWHHLPTPPASALKGGA